MPPNEETIAASATNPSFLNRTSTQIFLTSAFILFLELVLIRFLSAYMLHLAYFSNLVLIGSFFGIGVGCLISDRKHIFRFFPYLLPPLALIALLKVNVYIPSRGGAIYLQDLAFPSLKLPAQVFIPVIFALVAIFFIGPAQRLGRLLTQLEPLKAYAWDITGSLAGVIVFSLLSFAGAGPVTWFALIALVYFMLHVGNPTTNIRQLAKPAAAFVFLLALIAVLTRNAYWSPYYKITLAPLDANNAVSGYRLHANETTTQTLQPPEEKEWVYFTPYQYFYRPDYQTALIIGAGSGSDVALALRQNVSHIDAVEIDPTIAELGKRFHPVRPYDDPRVTVHINDGRNFLERGDRKYDLIVFALTDSIALASTYANTRMESYLFTLESFEAARRRLTENGLLVLYNYYRERWLIEKLAGMLQRAFGQTPHIVVGDSNLASLMVGPKLRDLRPDAKPGLSTAAEWPAASDDWPFVYLMKPSLPVGYTMTLVLILLTAWLVLRFTLKVKTRDIFRNFHWHFFWLGTGFLLLETKNVVNFQLLFGSTWLVNALVFVGILLMVLLATLLTQKLPAKRINLLYVMLLGILALNLLVPLKTLSPYSLPLRYGLAIFLTLSPIFFANLIFANSFKKTRAAQMSFAANIMGATIGGFSEYASMLVGYHYIVALTILFYVASWITKPKE